MTITPVLGNGVPVRSHDDASARESNLETKNAQGRRLHVVEALRGIAALSVAWFHLTNTYAAGWVTASGSYGWLGVEAFFVISGFIIPYSIATMYPNYAVKDFPAFASRRIVRLEPPYLLSIALTVGLAYASYGVTGKGEVALFDPFQVLFHVAYLVPFTSYGWLQPVYWTLAYEFAFYLFIGLAFPWLCQAGRSLNFASMTVLLCALVIAGFVPERVLLFAIGLAAYAFCFGTSGERGLAAAVGLVAAVAVAAVNPLIAATGASTAVTIVAWRNAHVPGRIGGVLLWLGSISYSLYLTHVPVGGKIVNLGRRFIEGTVAELALSLIALAVCLAFAQLFCWCIERPSIAWSRRLACARRRASH